MINWLLLIDLFVLFVVSATIFPFVRFLGTDGFVKFYSHLLSFTSIFLVLQLGNVPVEFVGFNLFPGWDITTMLCVRDNVVAWCQFVLGAICEIPWLKSKMLAYTLLPQRSPEKDDKIDVSVHPSGRQINRRPSFTTVMKTTKDDLSKMFDAKIVEIDAKIDAKIAEMSQNFEERMRKVLEEYLVEREKTHKEHKRNIKLDVVVDGDADTSLIPCTNDEDLDFFAAWSKIQSDCSLLVDDGLVRVNKKLLSAHSRYFEELLSDNVAEVGIEDVSHADMFHLLIVIYQISGKCEITEDKVESLLKLASKFRVPSVTKRCEVHLKNSVGVAISKKLQLSQSYGLHVAVDGDADTSLIPCTNDEEADCFASWSNIPSDCCLLVQGRLIHANKKLLSAHSQHFEELLSDDVAEVGIEDVSHADMFHLLIVIYQISGKCEITEDKVESLLKLASKFRVPNVTKRCEVYLIDSAGVAVDSVGVAVARNLQLSQTYGLKSVQEDAVKQMTKLEQSEALVNKVGDKECI